MKKIKPINLTFEYLGDKDQEQKKISEEAVKRAYDRIFSITAENIRERRRQQKKSSNGSK